MIIYVEIKNVYGNETIYPACQQSKFLAELAGHKTLTNRDIDTIKKLGYEIQQTFKNSLFTPASNVSGIKLIGRI